MPTFITMATIQVRPTERRDPPYTSKMRYTTRTSTREWQMARPTDRQTDRHTWGEVGVESSFSETSHIQTTKASPKFSVVAQDLLKHSTGFATKDQGCSLCNEAVGTQNNSLHHLELHWQGKGTLSLLTWLGAGSIFYNKLENSSKGDCPAAQFYLTVWNMHGDWTVLSSQSVTIKMRFLNWHCGDAHASSSACISCGQLGRV